MAGIGEEGEEDDKKSMFQLLKVRVSLTSMESRGGVVVPTFSLLEEEVLVTEEEADKEETKEDNFWHKDARAVLAVVKGKKVDRGTRYSAVLKDFGEDSTLIE